MDNNCISRRLFLNTLIIINKYLHITSWPEDKMVTLGGRVTCTQCNATSKRTKERCRAPARKKVSGMYVSNF